MDKIKNWIIDNHDLAFAILLAVCVYGYFAFTNEFFATHRTVFAIMERFAVLGLIGLALTLCIIAGEIDLSIGSNAALAAVIVVRFTDSLGAVPSLFIAVAVSTLIGAIQGYFIVNNMSFTAGIRNLTDEDPPYVTNYPDMNTINISYEMAGTYYYVRAGIEF